MKYSLYELVLKRSHNGKMCSSIKEVERWHMFRTGKSDPQPSDEFSERNEYTFRLIKTDVKKYVGETDVGNNFKAAVVLHALPKSKKDISGYFTGIRTELHKIFKDTPDVVWECFFALGYGDVLVLIDGKNTDVAVAALCENSRNGSGVFDNFMVLGGERGSIKNVRYRIDGNRVYNAWKEFKSEYRKLLDESRAHKRTLGGVEDMLSLYFTVTASDYSRAVKKFIGNYLEGYFTCAAALMKHMRADTEKNKVIYDSAHNAYSHDYYPIFIERTVESLRRNVGALLYDILRSDCAHFGSQAAARSAIGGAVKIIGAYTQTLYDWDAAYAEWFATAEKEVKKDIGLDTGFVYLVTSGGKDFTVNEDIFNYNHVALERYYFNGREVKGREVKKRYGNLPKSGDVGLRRPIIVTIPEASLYDVEGTLLRLLHEFFHKRGYRMMKDRACSYLNTLKNSGLNMLRYVLAYECVKDNLKHIYDNEFYRDPEWRWDDRRYISYNDWLTAVARCGERNYVEECKSKYGQDFETYRGTFDAIQKKLIPLYEEIDEVVDSIKESIDLGIVCDNYHTAEAFPKCRGEVINIIYKKKEVIIDNIIENMPSVIKNKRAQLHTFSCAADRNNPFEDVDIISRFTDRTRIEKGVMEMLGSALDGGNRNCNTIMYAMGYDGIEERFAEIAGGLFKECYADCMALSAMRPDGLYKTVRKQITEFIKYVFVSLFELRNPDDYAAASGKDFIAIRFDVVRRLFWSGINDEMFSGGGHDDVRKDIISYCRDVFDFTEERSKKYAEVLCRWLADLFEAAKKYSKHTDLLIEYLESCRTENKELFAVIKRTTEYKSTYDAGADTNNNIEFIFNMWLKAV